jgi:hypothetical protein
MLQPLLFPALLQNLASKLSRTALWQAYRQVVDGPADLTATGERTRTPGGQFIKLARKMISEEELRCEVWVGG